MRPGKQHISVIAHGHIIIHAVEVSRMGADLRLSGEGCAISRRSVVAVPGKVCPRIVHGPVPDAGKIFVISFLNFVQRKRVVIHNNVIQQPRIIPAARQECADAVLLDHGFRGRHRARAFKQAVHIDARSIHVSAFVYADEMMPPAVIKAR